MGLRVRVALASECRVQRGKTKQAVCTGQYHRTRETVLVCQYVYCLVCAVCTNDQVQYSYEPDHESLCPLVMWLCNWLGCRSTKAMMSWVVWWRGFWSVECVYGECAVEVRWGTSVEWGLRFDSRGIVLIISAYKIQFSMCCMFFECGKGRAVAKPRGRGRKGHRPPP